MIEHLCTELEGVVKVEMVATEEMEEKMEEEMVAIVEMEEEMVVILEMDQEILAVVMEEKMVVSLLTI